MLSFLITTFYKSDNIYINNTGQQSKKMEIFFQFFFFVRAESESAKKNILKTTLRLRAKELELSKNAFLYIFEFCS